MAEEVPLTQEEATLPEDSFPPAPPTNVVAKDTPNDAGKSITITWAKSSDDGAGRNNVIAYQILRSTAIDGEYEFVGNTTAGAQQFMDTDTQDKVEYFYKIKAMTQVLSSVSFPSQPAMS
ncbi:MAG: fibronectin type III domain-containing protein, partial [candidate division Zixibacteria bacterium]|nr:fibronectin type III domain-containing protein [candidate division Zixibacteria bacterium]